MHATGAGLSVPASPEARMAWDCTSRQRHTKGATLLLGSGVPPRRYPSRWYTHRPPRRQERLAQAVQVERGHVQV
jgi:hypothetical protein